MAQTGYYEADDVIITYMNGHILRLKTIEEYLGVPEKPRRTDVLPYMPKRFELEVSDDGWYKDQYKVIKSLIDRTDIDYVVHFGDPDNEGELIVREILGHCGNRHPVKRLWCNSMVPEVVADAYYNLKNDDDFTDKYLAARARQQFDWFYGINVSRYLTKKANQNFPAGRILIPITNYVYERDMAIENFTVKQTYGVDSKIIKGDWNTVIRTSKPNIEFALEEKIEATNLVNRLNTSDKIVISTETKDKKIKPHKLFNLSSFQSLFNQKYGYDLQESLNAIQKLYEAGYVTYPRTPVEYLSQKEAPEMERIITKLIARGHDLQFHKNKNVFDDAKCDGGHTALVITIKLPEGSEFEKLDKREQLAYMLIFNRTLSNFTREDAVLEETKVEIQADEYVFTITGNKIKSEGFLIYDERNIKEEIPEFNKGEKVDMEFTLQKRETSPPSKVTYSQLLNFLSNPYTDELKKVNKDNDEEYYNLLKTGATLGTEATTATIVANTQKYGYITKKKSTLSITPKGIAFIKLLKELNINLFKEKNVEMNKTIKLISNKALSFDEYKATMYNELAEIINLTNDINITINLDDSEKIGVCPVCGAPVIEKLHSFQCTNKECQFYIYKEDAYFKSLGKKINKTIAKNLLSRGEVKLNGLKSKKTGKEYSAIIKVDYSNNGKAQYAMSFPDYKPKKKVY